VSGKQDKPVRIGDAIRPRVSAREHVAAIRVSADMFPLQTTAGDQRTSFDGAQQRNTAHACDIAPSARTSRRH
jgi:hypothetical protein